MEVSTEGRGLHRALTSEMGLKKQVGVSQMVTYSYYVFSVQENGAKYHQREDTKDIYLI